MLKKDEFPELTHLLHCYFFQYWDEIYGPDYGDPIRVFLSHATPDLIVSLMNDIDGFLARSPSEEEIDAWLVDFHGGSLPRDFSDLLVEARELLVAALARE